MAVIKKKNTDVSKEEEIYMETQWQLMWRKFRKHKLAMLGGIILILLYTVGIFSEFFATQDIAKRSTTAISMAPTQIHFVDAEGNFSIQPFVYGLKQEEDPVTWKKYYVEDTTVKHNCVSFTRGIPISCLGLFPEIFTFSERLSRMYIFPSGRMLPVVTCIPAC